MDPSGTSTATPAATSTAAPRPTPMSKPAPPALTAPVQVPQIEAAAAPMTVAPPWFFFVSNHFTELVIGTVVLLGVLGGLIYKLTQKKKTKKKEDRECLNFKKLMEEKLRELTDLRGQVKNFAVNNIREKAAEQSEILRLADQTEKEYSRLKDLYEKCVASLSLAKNNIFIFHGTEGHPQENWFPWLKKELEKRGQKVFVPQFPSPPIVPAKISEWFDVLKNYEKHIDKNSIAIGHSLGGVFLLRVLEKLEHPIKAATFVGAPVGINPILNYDRDSKFSGYNFNWEKIRSNAKNFVVFHSDNDPYVGLENGKELARRLGVELSFIPGAGHFNAKSGYFKFEKLLEKLETLL